VGFYLHTDFKIAFVGGLAMPEDRENNKAYSQAGTLFQERLLDSLRNSGIKVSEIFSLRPVASYPADRRLFFGTGRFIVLGSFSTKLIPFVNLGPLKTISSGATLFPPLFCWAWKHRRYRNRAILLYNVSSPPGIVSVIAGRFTGTKVFSVVADIQVPGSGSLKNTFLRRLDFLLQTRTLGLLNGLITLTENIAKDFAPQTPSMLMEGAIPENLIEEGKANPYAVPEKREDDKKIVLMYAGGLSELKGIPLLLEAFALLQDGDYQLWITGKGPMQRLVEQAAKQDPRITYWGFPPYDRVLELYQKASILINPHSTDLLSARYLFPSKLIEYLATGKPVISTCSTPEVFKEYGGVVVPLQESTAEALGDKIRYIANMTVAERHAIGTMGRMFVLERKTWKEQGARIAKFIQKIVDGS